MVERSGNLPRRHHYVPRFYLSRFTDQRGRLRAHDRRTGRTITTTPGQVAVERDFYKLPDALGLPVDFLERLFSEQERDAARAIRAVVETSGVPSSARPTLAAHLAFQLRRTPSARDATAGMMEWSETIWAGIILQRRLDADDFESEDDRELAKRTIRELADGSLVVRPAQDSLAGLTLSGLEDIANVLLDGWNWVLVVLSSAGFVTTDHPVILLGEPEENSPATNLGLATAAEVWFPLDPRHALVLTRDWSIQSPIIDLPAGHLRALNQRLSLESWRWIFFRPGRDPLRGFQIGSEPPRLRIMQIGQRTETDGRVGELIRTGVERPFVPNERLLSGRRLRPFPPLDGIPIN